MSRLNILVVEDDPINILVAEKLLEKHFNIHIAKSAEAAIDSVTKTYFDVILMDINLGDDQLDGIDVMKKIRIIFTPLYYICTMYWNRSSHSSNPHHTVSLSVPTV